MEYREFVCAVEKQMNQKLKEEVKVCQYTALKNNGKERTGILIESPGVNISPTIYLEEYYESYLQGRRMDSIIEQLIGFYESIRQEKSWDCEQILSYDRIRDRVVFKLINTAKNKDFLAEIPHRMFLDLSIVFYILFDLTEEGMATMLVTEKHTSQWGVEAETLWQDAVSNVARLLPAELTTMNQAIREMMETEQGEPDNLLQNADAPRDSMYVLTNRQRNYGAACIAYPHMMEMIGDILQSDYYILPSSVHEVILLPYSEEISREEIDGMVKDINETQVDTEEVLSDHVYLYERSSRYLPGGEICQAGGSVG